MIQDRHVLSASAVASRCKDFVNDVEKGHASVVVAVTPLSLVLEFDDRGVPQLLLASTDRGVHAENAVRRSCSALLGQVGDEGGGGESRRCQGPCQRPSCRWPC